MAIAPRKKLRNCIQCGKVFLSQDRDELCNDCKAIYYDLEEKVKNYVRDNPGVSMLEVTEATGVSKKLLQMMMRSGAFMDMPMGDNYMYPCASCGTPIKIGTYCTSCLTRLRNETKKVSESMSIRFKDDTPTLTRLERMAQREFEQEQRDKRTFHTGLKNIKRSR